MNLSERAITLCRIKYGKGDLQGFEDMDDVIINDLTEEEEEAVIKELAEAELLAATDENIHLSPLAHHILNMMIGPEQHIRIENDTDGIAVSVYIRNAYYLCIIDNKNITRADDPNKYTVELLPRIDLVVGAFTYALGADKENASESDSKSLRITGSAWDKERNTIAELDLPDESEVSSDNGSMVNAATMWMLKNLAETESEEICIEEYTAEDEEEQEVTK